jgi:peptidyl-prolyl cis-trans isomerase SurA
MQEFVKNKCENYYRSHIEDFYPPIAAQVKEFNEANLLFAVMDKHVWSKAAEDSVGLKNYYEQHKQQYTWQPGVSALVVSSASKEAIDSIALQLKNNSANWRNIISSYNNNVTADSSRFENGQLPVKQKIPAQQGFISQPEKNDAGDTYTLVYVFDVYPQVSQRNFEDARGLVINDYQQVLEQKWIAGLKKKYPVKVNDALAKSL